MRGLPRHRHPDRRDLLAELRDLREVERARDAAPVLQIIARDLDALEEQLARGVELEIPEADEVSTRPRL
ncbi:MAG: hypothetical protein KF901_33295 [Myxococcales bacterium]|nr:hypothetical protein [Myxococcales bacterium]